MEETSPFRRNLTRTRRFSRARRESNLSTCSNTTISSLDSISTGNSPSIRSSSSSFQFNYSVNSQSEYHQKSISKVKKLTLKFEKLSGNEHRVRTQYNYRLNQTVAKNGISIHETPSEEEVDDISECDEVMSAEVDAKDDVDSGSVADFGEMSDSASIAADAEDEVGRNYVIDDSEKHKLKRSTSQEKKSDHEQTENNSSVFRSMRVKKSDEFVRNYRSNPCPKTEIIGITNRTLVTKYNSYDPRKEQQQTVTDSETDEDGAEPEEDIMRSKIPKDVLPIIEELIKTEENYVDNLTIGCFNYGEIFKRKNLPVGLKGKKFFLLGNIQQIADFHRDEFLPMLLRNRGDLKRLFDEFSAFIDENCFYAYVLFTMNKKNSLKLCDEFKHYFKELQNELNDKLGINSFLVQPIQRLARYPLMLQQFIAKLFKTGDIKYKSIIESCCKVEKRVRALLTTTNESERINDIEDCKDLKLSYQGCFKKVSDFYVIDYTLRRGYRSKVFMFERCIIHAEIRDKRLIFRGCYPWEHIGFLPKSKSFRLFYQKRKFQECEFQGDTTLIETWVELITDMIYNYAQEEKLKLKEKYSKGKGDLQSKPKRNSASLYRNSGRYSWDSGICNMWTPPKLLDETGAIVEDGVRTTWYTN